jgi:hypothetical protein
VLVLVRLSHGLPDRALASQSERLTRQLACASVALHRYEKALGSEHALITLCEFGQLLDEASQVSTVSNYLGLKQHHQVL